MSKRTVLTALTRAALRIGAENVAPVRLPGQALAVRGYTRGTQPRRPFAQTYRDLPRESPEEVIRAFESRSVPVTESTLGAYVRALVSADRLDEARVVSAMRAAPEAPAAYNPMAASPTPVPAAGAWANMAAWAKPTTATQAEAPAAAAAPLFAAAAVSEPLGSARNPLHTLSSTTAMGALFDACRSAVVIFVTWVAVLTAAEMFLESAGKAGGGGKGGLLGRGSDEVVPIYDTQTRFADVQGVDEAKAELEEIVEYLKSPDKFTRLGGKLPKGILLMGPPGTGKTMLARAIAGEAKVPFFYASGAEFEEVFVGVGARRIRNLFAAAKKKGPCIVFLDEIDAIGTKRNAKDAQYTRQTLNQLLVEMDGFRVNEGVIVIGATNVAGALDPALVRPGRFDRHVTVGRPDVHGREAILATYFRKVPMATDVDLSIVARATGGFSGADLANLVNLAAIKAAIDGAATVTMRALDHAKDRIVMGAEKRSLAATMTPESRRMTAYHEGGHAMVSLLTDGSRSVLKATILPRGDALGMVVPLPDKDETSRSRDQLLAQLDVALGGTVAEELVFGRGKVSTGATSDLQHATAIARDMVTRYGMSDKVGKISIPEMEDHGQKLISSETRSLVELEVRSIIDASYARVKALLGSREADLHRVATALIESETLSGDQIAAVLGLPTSPKAPGMLGTATAVAAKGGVKKPTTAAA